MHDARKTIAQIKGRRRKAGCDYDYISKLSDKDAEFLARFSEAYYDGNTSNPEEKLEANRRRYRASSADALPYAFHGMFDSSHDDCFADHLTPERILLLKEQLDKK